MHPLSVLSHKHPGLRVAGVLRLRHIARRLRQSLVLIRQGLAHVLEPAWWSTSISLAWRNAFLNHGRAAAAIAGTAVAIVLIFFQLGSLQAIRSAATLLYEYFDFDLAIVSRDYQFLYNAPVLDRVRLAQARAVPVVEDTFGLNLKVSRWVNPATKARSSLMLVGIDEKPRFLRDPSLKRGLRRLGAGDNVIIDSYSDPDYGDMRIGSTGRIRGRQVRIAARYRLGMFFYAEGSAVMGNRRFPDFSDHSSRQMNVGLIRLSETADPIAARAKLTSVLPNDVRVLTKAELIHQEQDYFVKVKPLGIIFRIGTFIAFVVGVVILLQVLATDLANRWSEFATLKAMGFDNFFVTQSGVAQSLILALCAYGPAWITIYFVFGFIGDRAHLPLDLGPPLTLTVLAITLTMCTIAALLGLRRVARADPAELFSPGRGA